MKSYLRHALDCKNVGPKADSHQIQIPFPKLLGKPPNPIETAKDIYAVNIACPRCKHVYEYTHEDIHHHLFQIPDQDLVPSEPISFVVEFVCDDPNCKSLARVHTMRHAGESKVAVIDRLRQSVFHTTCMHNHVLHFPNDPNSIVYAEDEGPFAPF
jgi:hypothetical protein